MGKGARTIIIVYSVLCILLFIYYAFVVLNEILFGANPISWISIVNTILYFSAAVVGEGLLSLDDKVRGLEADMHNNRHN